jgi:peptidoglycan hydrolase-like protein with peptidoglycan-binding domain
MQGMLLVGAIVATGMMMTAGNVVAQPSPVNLNEDQVKVIQIRLGALGFNAGQVDGNWGDGTANAVRRFQQSHGIEVTGEPNDLTLRMLGISSSVAQAGAG